MVFFGVKFFLSLRSAAEFFFRRHYFFLQKQYFFNSQSANRIYFFCPFQRQKIFFNQICRQVFFPKKNHSPLLQVKWMFPKNTFIYNNWKFHIIYSQLQLCSIDNTGCPKSKLTLFSSAHNLLLVWTKLM